MDSIIFCLRCRGMRVGWNRKYILHYLVCKEVDPRAVKLLIFGMILSSFILAFPVTADLVIADLNPLPVIETEAVAEANVVPSLDPAIKNIERLLSHYAGDLGEPDRVAKAIVETSKKENIDPKLVASIVIVESRGNPYAISESNSVGIMQIHLPTWGRVAERENINLFKIEDNIELGVRILKQYVGQYGLWQGIKHYKGWTDTPESQESAGEYAHKIKQIYQPQ